MIRGQPRLERLAATAAAAGLELAAVIELDRLHDVVAEVIAANGVSDGVARVSAWMDEEDMAGDPLHVAVTLRPAPHRGSTGLRLASLLNAPAGGSVAGRFASRHQARRRGADGAVVASSAGVVLYCTEGGLFAVVDRTVIMPESGGSMTDLPVFQELLTEMGFPLRTVTMTREMLRHASEVFVVDSALSVLDVVAIDRRPATAVRHEQSAVHMADAYARACGQVGVAIATSGPGATNLVTGIATAKLDSSPIVCITGQVSSQVLGTDAFQEIDIVGITMPITKHNYLVTRAEDIAPTIHQAFAIARSGRPGPVLVDITKYDQQATTELTTAAAPAARADGIPAASHSAGDLRRALDLIRTARRPVVLAGRGVLLSGAAEELREVAARRNTPVAMTLLGIGALPATHRLNLGMMGMHGEAWVTHALQD